MPFKTYPPVIKHMAMGNSSFIDVVHQNLHLVRGCSGIFQPAMFDDTHPPHPLPSHRRSALSVKGRRWQRACRQSPGRNWRTWVESMNGMGWNGTLCNDLRRWSLWRKHLCGKKLRWMDYCHVLFNANKALRTLNHKWTSNSRTRAICCFSIAHLAACN